MSGLIFIGTNCGNEYVKCKEIQVDTAFENATYIIDKSNWVGEDTYPDTFEVVIQNGKCSVRRIDKNDYHWGMNLIINAKKKYTTDNLIQTPILFINMKKNVDRLNKMQEMLYNLFDADYVHKIDGVKHHNGRDGCRLAHINAHIHAVNQGYDYYIIAEDDIQPLVEKEELKKYITDVIQNKPDLVLFEHCVYISKDELKEKGGIQKYTETLCRVNGIFQCVFDTGCYLCTKEFGKKLINHWLNKNSSSVACDVSWQELWKDNNVYFHRPQLFRQNCDYSDIEKCFVFSKTLFNWDTYFDS